MKKILLSAALLFGLNAQAQKFTVAISEPFCDTFKELRIEILTNVAPESSNLDSLEIYWRKSSKTGLFIDGNKKIKNDTALINPLKRKIIQGASMPVGVVPPVAPQKTHKQGLVAIKSQQ